MFLNAIGKEGREKEEETEGETVSKSEDKSEGIIKRSRDGRIQWAITLHTHGEISLKTR